MLSKLQLSPESENHLQEFSHLPYREEIIEPVVSSIERRIKQPQIFSARELKGYIVIIPQIVSRTMLDYFPSSTKPMQDAPKTLR
jgi:hypothetical protein